MSKVVITLDTSANELDVVVDGKSLNDITYVSVSKYCDSYDGDEEKVSISISQRVEPAQKGDLATFITLCASEKGDLVIDKNAPSPVQTSIANFIKSR